MVLSARALRSDVADFSRGGRWQAMRTMLSQFASREVPDLPVTLEFTPESGDKIVMTGRTDQEGFVHFEVELDAWARPETSQWNVVALKWDNEDGPQCVEGHVLAPAQGSNLGVISDIDDTIIETGITGSFRKIMRNWRRVLAQMPEDRLHVPGVDVFYGSLGGGAVLPVPSKASKTVPALTQRPFFYVSSSPWNLFSYLIAFKKNRGLPIGPVMLRDWAFDRETLGSEGHGKHKRGAIEKILAAYPDMRFALMGDDSQGDLTAYGDVVASHPGRIAAVFIRTIGEAMSPEEIVAKSQIEAAGVGLWLGNDYSTGEDFLRKSGLAKDPDAAQVIRTVSKAESTQT